MPAFIGQKLVNTPPRKDLTTIGYPTYTNGEIDMIHAGGVLGYMHKPGNVVHWGISSSAGVGVLNLYAKDPVTLIRGKIYNDRVYIVIPRIFTELNLTKWFKVNASEGYRFLGKVNGIYVNQDQEETPTFNKSEYTQPEFSVAQIFGAFGICNGILD